MLFYIIFWTNVGKNIYKHFNFIWIYIRGDTCSKIENDSKLDITTIFEKYGEEEFRNKETKLLEALSGVENHIVATGGGIILKQENIDIMKKMGLIVFLDIDLKTQIQRGKYRKHRPLLKNTDLEK